MRLFHALVVVDTVTSVLGTRLLGAQSAVCSNLVPAAVGGPTSPASVIQLRWLGTANYELVYGKTVVLLDAYYDRGPRNRPIGLRPDAITRADLILVGHAHFDHISDAAAVAIKTGSLVVGAPLSIKVVRDLGVPSVQTRLVTGRGGELLRFEGFTVQPILARHSVLAPAVLAKFRAAIREVIGPPTAADSLAEAAIRRRGSPDPGVETEGTIAYLFTFDTGFRLLFLDSAGPITDEERAVMAKIGRTDVAIVAYQGQYVARAQIAVTLPLLQLFRPETYIPAHHDEIAGLFLDLGLEPLFLAIREQLPGTKTISPLYLTPMCFSLRPAPR
jgi:L-ascorbate metabolism protein UlaG (beta-lactamase superfamily)